MKIVLLSQNLACRSACNLAYQFEKSSLTTCPQPPNIVILDVLVVWIGFIVHVVLIFIYSVMTKACNTVFCILYLVNLWYYCNTNRTIPHCYRKCVTRMEYKHPPCLTGLDTWLKAPLATISLPSMLSFGMVDRLYGLVHQTSSPVVVRSDGAKCHVLHAY